MDLANMPLFSALARKMNWLTARQKVLADNIAHVDVPNYKASDLRPLDFRKELAQASHKLEVATTNPGHLTRTGAHQGDGAIQVEKKLNERDINGNTVSLEDELIKVSETAADYQMMTNLYKKQIGMLKTALGKGGS